MLPIYIISGNLFYVSNQSIIIIIISLTDIVLTFL